LQIGPEFRILVSGWSGSAPAVDTALTAVQEQHI
jgi:hypothetical protein